MLQLSEAGIISTTMEALLYGFSLLMFILTLWILTRNRERRRLNHGMIITACSLQFLATAELTVNIVRVCQGLLNIGPSLLGGPQQYFDDVTQPTFIFKSSVSNLQALILDAVVIYRTYVVWQSYYVVVIPILGWFALLTSCIGTIVALASAAGHANNMFAVQTARWITAIYSTTLATNLSSSSLLAYRIWRVNRDAAKYRASSQLTPVLRAVIESGAIYSVTITAALILFVVNSPGIYVLLDMVSPIISIVFNLLILRVGFATNRHLPVISSTVQQTTTLTTPRFRPNTRRDMKPLTVEITQFFESDAETSSVISSDRDTTNKVEGREEDTGKN
ncbi:uncharacterized protein FOMMEDRAFT_148592 [Fomitiporia mediterranea MF3/22]|uniref:uncharacterized protein n=1 Tax=Fomitiporia mediterranea (strain MF3/22) TaxID=694068 RepID=UPI0004408C8C|nr:uncharacterized protein FOMMEDRAFT_148592 [Fomitiporia mediterranea MF3/22]EJC99740.1 hypothetical protein FOMMEDRAFT_148592 [Fomitiporia mediterranea MF3/22]